MPSGLFVRLPLLPPPGDNAARDTARTRNAAPRGWIRGLSHRRARPGRARNPRGVDPPGSRRLLAKDRKPSRSRCHRRSLRPCRRDRAACRWRCLDRCDRRGARVRSERYGGCGCSRGCSPRLHRCRRRLGPRRSQQAGSRHLGIRDGLTCAPRRAGNAGPAIRCGWQAARLALGRPAAHRRPPARSPRSCRKTSPRIHPRACFRVHVEVSVDRGCSRSGARSQYRGVRPRNGPCTR